MDATKLKRTNNVLYSVFFVFFIGYISTLQYRPYPFSYLVKVIPILSLAVIARVNISGVKGKFVVAGMLFSAVGDTLLAFSGKGLFVFGLSAFALAHVMYIMAFFREPAFKSPRILFAGGFLLYGLAIGYFIVPNMQRMQIPVSIYIVLIIMMGISTVAGKNNHYLVIVGAVLFIISDSVIAFNMFVWKISNSSFWIMITYYPAQFLIIKGVLKTEKRLFPKQSSKN
jgi:alkenylglycerophosphocholine hydrolase